MKNHPFDSFAENYGPIACVPKNTPNAKPVYLGASAANYVSLVEAGDATKCLWMRDVRGQLWLSASLTQYRYLGCAEQSYADWGIGQAPGVGGYTSPLFWNPDGTISMANSPDMQLYRDDTWAKWGVGRGKEALVLSPAAPPV